MREAVVLIHGLWMAGWEMLPLRRRLKACGFPCHQFSYHSLLQSPAANAERLETYLRGRKEDIVHLVAHSLGGIVVLHLFDRYPNQQPGRVLLLGVPLNGSAVARNMYGHWLTRSLLGKSVIKGVLGDTPPWKGTRELAMIAGSRGVGIGNVLFAGLARPNDGTVAVSETRSPGLDHHLTVAHSHVGMLWAPDVADVVCRFLAHGRLGAQ